MLVLKRRPKQCIWIDKKVYIEIANVRGSEVEIHIDFPTDYEVLRGELVELEAPKPKSKRNSTILAKALKTFALGALFLMPSCAFAEEKPLTLGVRTLLCETPLDYYGAFEKISEGKISVDEEFPKTRHNCLWTDRVYLAKVIMVAHKYYLAEIAIIDPSENLELVRGWVGLSEVRDPLND